MKVETLLGLWDGFGGVAVYEKEGEELGFCSYREGLSYAQLIEKFGKREVRCFGLSSKEEGLLEIFLK